MTSRQKNTLTVAMTTAFITSFMGSSLNLAIPNIEAQFGVGASIVGWVVTAYMLTTSALNVPFGKIADVTGRRWVIICGIGTFSVASLIGAFSVNIAMLFAMRVLQGVGAAMIFSTNNAILMSAFPASERGSVLGKSTASTYIGLSAGPVVGGLLNGYLGWRSIFITSSLVGLVAFITAVKGLPKVDEPRTGARFDRGGAVMYIAMILLVMVGLTDLTIAAWAWISLAAGVVIAIVFGRFEMKVQDPVISMEMLVRDRAFLFSNLATLLNYGATFTVGYLLSIYLQLVMGFSSQVAGLILVAQPVMQAVFSPSMGKLSDRVPPHKVASCGMGMCVIGLIMLTRLTEDTSLVYVIAILLIMGLGFAVFSSPNVNAIMSRVDPADFGVANSIVATMRNLGQTSSMAVVTILMGMTLGNAALAEVAKDDLMHAITLTFGIFVIVCAVGIVLSLTGRREKK